MESLKTVYELHRVVSYRNVIKYKGMIAEFDEGVSAKAVLVALVLDSKAALENTTVSIMLAVADKIGDIGLGIIAKEHKVDGRFKTVQYHLTKKAVLDDGIVVKNA